MSSWSPPLSDRQRGDIEAYASEPSIKLLEWPVLSAARDQFDHGRPERPAHRGAHQPEPTRAACSSTSLTQRYGRRGPDGNNKPDQVLKSRDIRRKGGRVQALCVDQVVNPAVHVAARITYEPDRRRPRPPWPHLKNAKQSSTGLRACSPQKRLNVPTVPNRGSTPRKPTSIISTVLR